jgi:hypothetical protein
MGNRREQDAQFFYDMGELCEMTGYTPKRLNEIVRRYRGRLGPDGRAQRCYFLKEKGIFNDDFSDWLLETRFGAPIEIEQPEDAISLQEVAGRGRGYGLSYEVLRNLARSRKLRAWVYLGRYYIGREEAGVLLERYRYAQAPDDWFPVVALVSLCRPRCSRQNVYSWVKRQSRTKTFIHPGRSQFVQYMPIGDALRFLTRVLGSTHKAFFALTKHAAKYFRALRKRAVDLFRVEECLAPLNPTTLAVIFTTGKSQPPPLNSSGLGHGLLSLRT